MHRFTVAFLAALVLAQGGFAQDKSKDKPKKDVAPADLPKNAATVALQTEDGVILVATYWKTKVETRRKSEGSKQTPVVIIPSPRGHTQRETYPFAQELSENGLAVVTFDFRGSGQSTQTVSIGVAKKGDGSVVRSEDVLKTPQTIEKLLLDLDAVKQFLLRENNAEKLNIRQSAILAVGDLATVVTLNWVASREFGSKNEYTRQGGDLAALCLVSPSNVFKAYKAPQRLNDPGTMPIYLVSSGSRSDPTEKIARLLKVPELSPKKGAADDRKARPGGWTKSAPKKGAKGASGEIGIELFRGADTSELRENIRGFLTERTKSRREIAWEGGRDVDQSFKILSRSDQEE